MLVKNFSCEKNCLRKISVTINFSYEKFRRKLGRNFSSTKFFVRKVIYNRFGGGLTWPFLINSECVCVIGTFLLCPHNYQQLLFEYE